MNVPFYSQHWDLEAWEELGFRSKEEAQYWQNSCCGILCLKMGVEALLKGKTLSVSELIRKGLNLHAYSHRNGWSHAGLVELAKEIGIPAFSNRNIHVESLKKYVDQGFMVVVSIKWAFEPTKTLRERIIFWQKVGGHLALVIGYDENGFKVHHTSTLKEYNWEDATISFAKFEKAFTGRGVVIYKQKSPDYSGPTRNTT